MKRYADLAGSEFVEDTEGTWVKWEEANARVAELEASRDALRRDTTQWKEFSAASNARADAAERSLDAADRAGLELAKQLETAERKVKACKAVLSRRYSEPGHWENPAGDLCSADELEAALEDK
jgi:hypothetical protein